MIAELLVVMKGFWVSFLIAGICAYPIYRLLIAWKSRQTVSQYAPEGHQKKQGTPTMGGLIICAGFIGAMVYFMVFPPEHLRAWHSKINPLAVALVLFVGFALIGFVDDFVVPRLIEGKRGLGWKQKILLELVIGSLGAGMLTQWDFGAGFWMTLFFVLFFSNAYNFSDGLDGLAGSLLLGLGFGLLALLWHGGLGVDLALVVAALLGSVIPFLLLNAPPARVFMGDVGSLAVGAALGLVVSVMLLPVLAGTVDKLAFQSPRVLVFDTTDNPWGLGYMQAMPWALGLVSIMMIIELVPVPLQILSVKLRKKKLFPYTPIHHAFEKAGWPETRVVWVFALFQLLLAGLASYVLVSQLNHDNDRLGFDRLNPPVAGRL